MSESLNLIKQVCRDHTLTYAQLGERIGYSESTINKVASTGEISATLAKAIELYIQTTEQQKQINKLNQLKVIFKDLMDIN